MMRAQMWRGLQLKLIETRNKMEVKMLSLKHGSGTDKILSNPDWYDLLVDKHDKKGLLRLKSQCLETEKINSKLLRTSTHDHLGPKIMPKCTHPHEKGKHHTRNVKNKKLCKGTFGVTCETEKRDKVAKSVKTQRVPSPSEFFALSTP